jgi:hypothetical protein
MSPRAQLAQSEVEGFGVARIAIRKQSQPPVILSERERMRAPVEESLPGLHCQRRFREFSPLPLFGRN